MSGEEAGRAVENNRKSKHQKKAGIWGVLGVQDAGLEAKCQGIIYNIFAIEVSKERESKGRNCKPGQNWVDNQNEIRYWWDYNRREGRNPYLRSTC